MIRKPLIILFTVIIFLFIYSSSNAAMRIAVMDFKAKNVSKATANMVCELIRTEMINTGRFVVIERAQMDEILKEQGFQQSGCTDVSCAVQVGKMLSAKKILVGTVMKLGSRIIINGRIVDVEKGTGEFGQKQDAKSESGLYDAVSAFVKKLSRRIKTGERRLTIEEEEEDIDLPPFKMPGFGINVAGSYLMAQGEFSKISSVGYGGNAGFNINFSNIVLMLTAGYYIFDTVEEWIDSIQTITGVIYLGYSMPAARRIRVTPSIGGGALNHMVSHDERGKRIEKDYEFTTNNYLDPLASARLEFDIILGQNFHFILAPVYTIFFEKSSNSQLVGGDVGFRICF